MGLILYWQVFFHKKIDFAQLQIALSQAWAGANYYFLLISVLLMPLNWFLELYKWLFVMRRYEFLTLWQGAKAILLGLTVSLFTPNRVGEYGGRLLLVKKEHRLIAVYATVVGNFAQWVVLCLFGTLGLLFLVYNNLLKFNSYNINGIRK